MGASLNENFAFRDGAAAGGAARPARARPSGSRASERAGRVDRRRRALHAARGLSAPAGGQRLPWVGSTALARADAGRRRSSAPPSRACRACASALHSKRRAPRRPHRLARGGHDTRRAVVDRRRGVSIRAGLPLAEVPPSRGRTLTRSPRRSSPGRPGGRCTRAYPGRGRWVRSRHSASRRCRRAASSQASLRSENRLGRGPGPMRGGVGPTPLPSRSQATAPNTASTAEPSEPASTSTTTRPWCSSATSRSAVTRSSRRSRAGRAGRGGPRRACARRRRDSW